MRRATHQCLGHMPSSDTYTNDAGTSVSDLVKMLPRWMSAETLLSLLLSTFSLGFGEAFRKQPASEEAPTFHSQIGQDEWVLRFFDRPRFYLDVGASESEALMQLLNAFARCGLGEFHGQKHRQNMQRNWVQLLFRVHATQVQLLCYELKSHCNRNCANCII